MFELRDLWMSLAGSCIGFGIGHLFTLWTAKPNPKLYTAYDVDYGPVTTTFTTSKGETIVTGTTDAASTKIAANVIRKTARQRQNPDNTYFRPNRWTFRCPSCTCDGRTIWVNVSPAVKMGENEHLRMVCGRCNEVMNRVKDV